MNATLRGVCIEALCDSLLKIVCDEKVPSHERLMAADIIIRAIWGPPRGDK